MNTTPQSNIGIKRLVEKYKKAFRIPENLEYYAEGDLKRAERKYIKSAVSKGRVSQREKTY